MKTPNFRLYDTQATTGVLVGIAAIGCLAALMYCSVGRGLDLDQGIIAYAADSPWGQYRNYVVMGLTAASIALGTAAGLLGFNSLGQKRNNLQARSWLGLAMGAFVDALAPVFFLAWWILKESII